MDWYLILAIAIPFLFVIGVINNAIKDQHKLEKGKLQGFLQKRVGKKDNAYDDDEDDWGIKARQDLKKALEESEAQIQEPKPSEQDQVVNDLSGNNPLSDKTVGNFKPLGDHKAKTASDYFANYYK